MKKIFILAILLLGTFSIAFAELKVGFVDTSRLLRDSAFAQRATADLEKEFSKREKKLIVQGQKLQQELEQLQAQYKALAEQEYIERKKNFDLKEEKFQEEKRIYEEDLSSRKLEKLQQLFEIAEDVVKSIAQKEGIDLVLDRALYFNPQLDLTSKVLKELDRRND